MPNEITPVVLVADDEEEMRTLIQRFVESQGYKVHTAADGDEAWDMAREFRPDLVLLDVRMPGLSGWEVSRNIQHDRTLAHTQVIMITGIGETLNELTSPVFGAFSYLDKPFDLDVLEGKMRAALEANRQVRARGSSRGAATNGVSGPAVPTGAQGISDTEEEEIEADLEAGDDNTDIDGNTEGDEGDREAGYLPPRRSAASSRDSATKSSSRGGAKPAATKAPASKSKAPASKSKAPATKAPAARGEAKKAPTARGKVAPAKGKAPAGKKAASVTKTPASTSKAPAKKTASPKGPASKARATKPAAKKTAAGKAKPAAKKSAKRG